MARNLEQMSLMGQILERKLKGARISVVEEV